MNTLNAILTRLADLCLGPLDALPGLITLIICSIVFGVVASLAFRWISNQKALGDVADRVRANLLAMRLFKDELGVTLRCQGDLLKAAGLRFWYALPPLLVLTVPFVLLLVQLALRFEHRPLRPGEAAIVELQLSPEAWSAWQNVQLEPPMSVAVETPALRDEREHTISWRLRPHAAEVASLRWEMDGQVFEKRLDVSENPRALRSVSPRRPGAGLWDRVLHPCEPGFSADAPARAVVVRYPRRTTPIFGFDIPWWLTLLIVSILAALLLRPILKVRF